MNFKTEQEIICKKYQVPFVEALPSMKIGIALNVKSGIQPINGLRHPPESGTSGWFIWAGEEFSNDPDFFVPLHIEHLTEWCPQVIKYLGLPPGWRFLIAAEHEDVWKDDSILKI